jgi:hypothetical protein
VRRGLGGRFLFHAEAVTRGLCARGHEATEKVVILYIYTHTRARGYAGTGTTFSYPREKTRRVENQTRTRTHGYKLTPKPAPYRVFTRGHAGKMCPLPSLRGTCSTWPRRSQWRPSRRQSDCTKLAAPASGRTGSGSADRPDPGERRRRSRWAGCSRQSMLEYRGGRHS